MPGDLASKTRINPLTPLYTGGRIWSESQNSSLSRAVRKRRYWGSPLKRVSSFLRGMINGS